MSDALENRLVQEEQGMVQFTTRFPAWMKQRIEDLSDRTGQDEAAIIRILCRDGMYVVENKEQIALNVLNAVYAHTDDQELRRAIKTVQEAL